MSTDNETDADEPDGRMLGSNARPASTDWIPRDPRRYGTTDHFERRAASQDRIITHDLAAEVITRAGDPVPCGSAWRFEMESQGLLVKVYCVLGAGFIPSANSGYAEVTDLGVAMASDRWDDRALTCEYVRWLVHTSEKPWPNGLWTIEWDEPISVHGHPVSWDYDEGGQVICVACGREYWSGDELNETSCVCD